jgi:DNA invertase Pin-like site-specific DNA recombinase
MQSSKVVAYYRVSTARQGRSGLGLDGQRAAVDQYVAAFGCSLIARYTEIETGKKHNLDNRPELRKAVAHAARSKAILVVAKLDRLLRSTVVHATLKTAGVKFIACDNPHANELTLDILAAVAANEAREISARTKAALQAAKARGVKLGATRPESRNLTPAARRKGIAAGAQAVKAKAATAYADLAGDLKAMRARGMSLRQMAASLNEAGHTTRRGQSWNAVQVLRALAITA